VQQDVPAAPAPGYTTASDETLAVHAGEKLRKNGMADTDSIATPIVSGTTHWFKNSDDLIAFKEGRRHSFEYGRYGNPTVSVLEEKISALERAEATLVTSSGMNAIVATLLALVPPGGHVVTTTECYSEARAFIRERLSKMGIRVMTQFRATRACMHV
jgi:cystathionine gamma-synthase